MSAPPLYLGLHMSIAGGVSRALDRAETVGSNAVQIFTKNNRQWQGPPVDVEDVARWQAEMPARGIQRAVSHASYLINLASDKPDLWAKSQRAHADELRRAHAYGVTEVVLHPGAHTGAGVDFGVTRIAEALNNIHAETPECAPEDGNVRTLLELMAGQGTVLGRNFAELRQIIEQVDEPSRVGVCVDTCHAFAAGYDLRTRDGYEALVDEIECEVGLDAVGCWHLNDSQHDLGSHRDRHTHIGEGCIGDDGFRHLVNDPRWAGVPLLLETPKDDDPADDIRNQKRLMGLVEDQGRIPVSLRSEA